MKQMKIILKQNRVPTEREASKAKRDRLNTQ